MTRASGRAYGVIVLVLAGGAVLGGLLGGGAQAEGQSSAETKLRDFARTLALVEDNYAGKVDSQEMVEDAIQGMLRTLDPHSNFLDRGGAGWQHGLPRGCPWPSGPAGGIFVPRFS